MRDEQGKVQATWRRGVVAPRPCSIMPAPAIQRREITY